MERIYNGDVIVILVKVWKIFNFLSKAPYQRLTEFEQILEKKKKDSEKKLITLLFYML